MVRTQSQRRGQVARRSATNPAQTVRAIYRKLSRAWGPQHWWPAVTSFEVVVGAILTQNTSWANVERALGNLRAAGVLSVDGIRSLKRQELEQLIRPSGYFRQKASRLKDFVAFLDMRYSGSLEAMLEQPTPDLRKELVAQKGIGPETADSILLYAGQHPIFVVDAYTRRVLARHDAIPSSARYDEVRELVEAALQREAWPLSKESNELHAKRPEAHPPSPMSSASRSGLAQVYNEMHGLFVQLGKHYCSRRRPKCDVCPLGAMLTRPVKEEMPARSRRAASGAKPRVSKGPANPQV